MILGASGQDGSYLTDLLLDRGYHVLAVTRSDPAAGTPPNLAHIDDELLVCAQADFLDTARVRTLLSAFAPHEIYNFAGVTFGPDSWADPARTAALGTTALAGLLEALRDISPDARFFQASSCWIYGRPATEPQDEHTPIAPVEPYGAAKAYGQHLIGSFREKYGLFLCSGIFYNHESPRRPPQFVSRKITLAAARIANQGGGEIALGDIEAQRDWGFAGDFVDAASRAVLADSPRDYVIATGRLHSVADLAERAFSRVGLDWRDHVRLDDSLRRTAEVRHLRGDASAAGHYLSWAATTSFESMIDLMVDADLARLQAASRS